MFLHILHLLRGGLGILIVFKLPRSSANMDKITKHFNQSGGEQLKGEELKETLWEAAKVLFEQYLTPIVLYTLMSYFIFTCI